MVSCFFAALAVLAATLVAQDRLKSMPGYDQYQKMSKEIAGAFKSGALSVTWKDAGATFEYQKDNIIYRYDIATKTSTEVGPAPNASRCRAARPGTAAGGPGRRTRARTPGGDGALARRQVQGVLPGPQPVAER